jgi:lysophospholipase L1-like esterase
VTDPGKQKPYSHEEGQIMKSPLEFLTTLGRTLILAIGGTRRQFLKTVVAALALAVAGYGPAAFADDRHGDDHGRRDRDKRWVGTWSTALHAPDAGFGLTNAGFNGQTLRQIVHTSIGGDTVRVRLSTFGASALVVGAAHIALRDTGAAIVPGSDRVLTFSGNPSITIPPGAVVLSDPVDLDVPALGDLAVSLFVPDNTGPATWHFEALQTSYISPPGDFTGSTDIPGATTTQAWFWLAGVEVKAPKQTGAIVCLGDSITDGTASTPNTNNRWPNHLATRLLARRGNQEMGVLDEGIAGNRVLHDIIGANALARLDRDVLVQTGVTHVIVLEGINDIGFSGIGFPDQAVSADEIIAGHTQLIERVHARGLKIFGGTLTPFEGTTFPGYFTPEGEAKRQAVNHWIRTSGEYDGVIDFDKATRDPSHPARLLPAYDSGDHLHPSDAGYQAMADAINLRLFKQDDDGHHDGH